MHTVNVQSVINVNFQDSYSSVVSLHSGTYGVVTDCPRKVTNQEALVIAHVTVHF